jgi:hypothetical protein
VIIVTDRREFAYMTDGALVLLARPTTLRQAAVVEAARGYGVELVPDPPDEEPGALDDGRTLGFSVSGGAGLVVGFLPEPVPDATRLPLGPTSPTAEAIAASPAHLLIVAPGLTGPVRERDTRLAVLTAAVVETVDAVGVMFAHGVVPHRPDVFTGFARLAVESGEPLAAELAVDITAARESDTHMSFLTHGLRRYGREEFYITCPIEGMGALGFTFDLARWMLADPDNHLPTGDTVGRSAEERVVVQRVPDPAGHGPEVIRLDLS